MNNDLISREALKKEFEKIYLLSTNEMGVVVNKQIYDIIDNAPTVEPTFKPIAEVKFDKEQMQELVDKAKAEVLASVERPQGDLISREALKKKLKENHDFFVNAWGGFKNLPPNDKARVDEITNCISEVVNAPTINPSFNLDNITEEEIEKFKIIWQRANSKGLLAINEERPKGDLIKAFELLKAHCKNRECNKDCVFYRELRAGNDIEQFCGLCEIVTSDDKEVKKNETNL